MRVAIVSPPFITVPPTNYGGTELFIADLACGLKSLGVSVVVYTNGESTVDVEKRWLYSNAVWPVRKEDYGEVRDADHTTWALRDAVDNCDVIHLNSAQSVACSRLISKTFVYTLHHSTAEYLSNFYARFPDVHYVCISNDQRSREHLPNLHTIHHGVDLGKYRLREVKEDYLSFIGRIAPLKGTHLAIEIARLAGLPLKIAGEVQPMYRDYFEKKVRPHIDGKSVEYIGEADLATKNELLGNSRAMLFPITWNEPFGLVLIESMACGTPVLAFRRGSVAEIVRDGVSGYTARTTKALAQRAVTLNLSPMVVRQYVQQHFSVERMAQDYLELYTHIVSPPTA